MRRPKLSIYARFVSGTTRQKSLSRIKMNIDVCSNRFPDIKSEQALCSYFSGNLAFVCSFHMQLSLSLKVAVLYETQFACASRRSKGKLAFYSQANLGKFYSFFMLILQTFGTSKSCQLGLVTCLSRVCKRRNRKQNPRFIVRETLEAKHTK